MRQPPSVAEPVQQKVFAPLDKTGDISYYPAALHGACSSVVERQIVDLVVVGSSPIGHPALRSVAAYLAFVAQPDRAVDFESEGCTFKSCRTR